MTLKKIGMFLVSGLLVLALSATTVFASRVLPELTPSNRGQNQEFLIAQIEFLLSEMMAVSEYASLRHIGQIELGERFNVYRYEHHLEAIEDIHWYPVLANGSVVAIVSLHGDPNMPVVSLRSEFAFELQAFIERNDDTFALLFEGENLYVVTNNTREVLLTYYGVPAVNSIMPFSDTPAEMQFSRIRAFTSLTPYSGNEMSRNFPGSVGLSVPVVLQGNTNLCWAASVSSKGRFMTGQGATWDNLPHSIARAMDIDPHSGATVTQTRDALSHVFGIHSNEQFRAPTLTEVLDLIANRGRPIITFFWPAWGMGHAVVLSGYSSSSQGISITYMDPNFGFGWTFTQGIITIVVGSEVMTAGGHLR